MTHPQPDNMTSGEAEVGPAPEYEPWLRERLEWFSDLKFGLFVHWGIYSQWGCTESWPLVQEEAWARDPHLPQWIECGGDVARFQEAYRALNTTFDPRAFDPGQWVETALGAGMRYFAFSTKHHDGFCMWDTATTEYRITHESCPFHSHRMADVTRALFDRFRGAGLAISCYFSKSDWHCPHYWWPEGPAPRTRNPNYDTRAHRERWRRFVEYTHAQVAELMSGYGPIDVLWLDGGQVRPPEQDIEMDRLVAMARRYQPALIVADRTVGGEHENFLTPEQRVPDCPPGRPWETCLTLGTSFSYKPNDEYKCARRVIALLADIASKGGNLLLGVGADARGVLPEEAARQLRGVGEWLSVNGEAIFGTRSGEPFAQSDERVDMRFTRRGRTVYVIILAKPMQQRPPREVRVRGFRPAPGSAIAMLGVREPSRWRVEGGELVVTIPTEPLEREPAHPAWVLKVETGA